MNPSGSAARKKLRSKALRLSPEHPRTTARGNSSGNDAPDVAPLQFPADPAGIRHRPCLDAVEHPLFTEIGADRGGRHAAEQIRIGPLDAVPFVLRRLLAAHRTE